MLEVIFLIKSVKMSEIILDSNLIDSNQFIICFIFLGMPDQYYQVKVNATQIGEAINKFMKGNPKAEIVVVRNTRFDKEDQDSEMKVIT